MSKNWTVILSTVLLTTSALGALGWVAKAQGWIRVVTPLVADRDKELDSTTPKLGNAPVSFFCEVTVSTPKAELRSEPKVQSEYLVAGLDAGGKSGWYQGEYSISESRKGALRMEGAKAVVSRPAMFERFGKMITQEEFSLDLRTGAFVQTLSFNDGTQRHMIKGVCAKYIKAPFY